MERRVGSVMGGCGRGMGWWGAGFGGTFINRGLIYRHPASPPQLREWREMEGQGGWQTFVSMHMLTQFKWERPVADRYWSCRHWQWRVGPSHRLCPNLRICSSSCLHNEVKWSEEMLGWPWPKHSTPDVPLTDLAWARAGFDHEVSNGNNVRNDLWFIVSIQAVFRLYMQFLSKMCQTNLLYNNKIFIYVPFFLLDIFYLHAKVIHPEYLASVLISEALFCSDKYD